MTKWTLLLRLFRQLLRLSLVIITLLVLGTTLSVINNNVSFSQLSRVNFENSLDHSLAASTGWSLEQFPSDNPDKLMATDLGMELVSNASLVHMLVDCSSISHDPQLQQLSSKFVAAYHQHFTGLMRKLVDPALDGVAPLNSPELEEYQRWILHAISPAALPLSAAEQADMFSPDKYSMYNATHQLFSLYILRKFNGDTPELSNVMDRLEGRIAAEAALDFRVTDLYLQRIAFLLAAGRPDLVKPRWVERSLAAQRSDGGWIYTWYGWGPQPFSYTFSDARSVAHSTAQGMWLTNMLKYRYPGWIEKNYK